MSGGGQFRVTVWDPALITSQIVCVQSLFYFSFGAFLILSSILFGVDINLANIFDQKAINFGDRNGIITIICYIFNALAGSLILRLVVKRTKQCLDFSATCYLIHLSLSFLYNGTIPSTVSWWLLTIAGVTIMCVCGEFLCLKSELKDIPLLGGRADL